MIRFRNDILKEEYFVHTLDNGLKVYLVPKNKFYKTYAILSTNYGSRDLEFIPIGEKEYVKTPEGVAHFLEHKIFEQSDGTDASTSFAKYGASVNAFTTNYLTSYLFQTTSNLYECIELLLDFVQTPIFTKKSIEKERGIIEQELLMYLDQPENVQYFGILKNLYKNNTVRNEIGGTVESIKRIDEKVLFTCYNTFYQPSNMSLVIVGKFNKDEVLDLITSNQKKKNFKAPYKIIRKLSLDDDKIYKKESIVYMDVATTMASLALKIKTDFNDSFNYLKKAIIFDLLADLYFNESSKYYEKLLFDNVIDNSFEYSVSFDFTYAHMIFNQDTNDYEKFFEKMIELFNSIRNTSIDENDFERIKRLRISREIKRFDSLEYIANTIIETEFDGCNIFDIMEIINSIKLEDLENAKNAFIEENTCCFVIKPKNEAPLK